MEHYKKHYTDHIQYAKNGTKEIIEILQFQKAQQSHNADLEMQKRTVDWLFVNDDIINIKNFLGSNFNSYFQFRIDKLSANSMLGWHNGHPYPRVFIPLHENKTEFLGRKSNDVESKFFLKNECWYWDVREWHKVVNHSDEDRYMALFNIDPSIEKIAKFGE